MVSFRGMEEDTTLCLCSLDKSELEELAEDFGIKVNITDELHNEIASEMSSWIGDLVQNDWNEELIKALRARSQ